MERVNLMPDFCQLKHTPITDAVYDHQSLAQRISEHLELYGLSKMANKTKW